jgi:hypothetical protein
VLVITPAVLSYVALTDFKEFKIRNELILVLASLFASCHLNTAFPALGRFARPRKPLAPSHGESCNSVLVTLNLIGARPPSSRAAVVAIFCFFPRFYRETQRVKAVRQLIEFSLLFFR